VRRDDADARLLEHAELRSRDGQRVGRNHARAQRRRRQISALGADGLAARLSRDGVRVLAHRQAADFPLADTARKLAAVLEIDDLPRVAQADAPREERPAVLRECVEPRYRRFALTADAA